MRTSSSAAAYFFLVDEVNDITSVKLIQQLMYLERKNPGEEITFYINSPSGIVQSGIAVYDYIKTIPLPKSRMR